MSDGNGGSGPGGHPGVTIITLTNDLATTKAELEATLEAGGEFLFTYGQYAVFASGYGQGNS